MGNGKVAALGLVSILLVAMVVAVAVTVSKKSNDHGGSQVNYSNKAAEELCSSTDYKETCLKSMANSADSDPKKLIQAAFNYSVETLNGVIKESQLYKDAQKDERVKKSLHVCEEVLNNAIDDLNRSFEKVNEYGSDISTAALEIVDDLRSWMSAIGTQQMTCIDSFDESTSETGEKMKELLKTSFELSSNGLAMLDHVSAMIKKLDLFHSGRRLFAAPEKVRQLYDFNSPPASTAGINAVVAKDGSGMFTTVSDAIASVPIGNNVTFVIFVREGVYAENVVIPRKVNKIVMVGDGPTKTIITGSKNTAIDGVLPYETATFAVNGMDFVAKNMAFENTAGPAGGEAVALRVSNDRAVFDNVHVIGNYNSLYAQAYRQFYSNCVISGTIDSVFGDARAVFQNCNFVVRKPGPNQVCTVTAQGRFEPRSDGAFVIQGGKITAEPAFLSTTPPPMAYLGRPLKELSRTIIMQAEIEGFIAPEGWSPMDGLLGLDTLYYAEYLNRGPGSDTAKRVTWKGIQRLDDKTAETWTPAQVFMGDKWITDAVPTYVPGMLKA